MKTVREVMFMVNDLPSIDLFPGAKRLAEVLEHDDLVLASTQKKPAPKGTVSR